MLIPAEILLDEKLTDKEKFILSMILYLSDETGSCFASNQYIASVVKVTSKRIIKLTLNSEIILALTLLNYMQMQVLFHRHIHLHI